MHTHARVLCTHTNKTFRYLIFFFLLSFRAVNECQIDITTLSIPSVWELHFFFFFFWLHIISVSGKGEKKKTKNTFLNISWCICHHSFQPQMWTFLRELQICYYFQREKKELRKNNKWLAIYLLSYISHTFFQKYHVMKSKTNYTGIVPEFFTV